MNEEMENEGNIEELYALNLNKSEKKEYWVI